MTKTNLAQCMRRETYDAATLMADHPPRFRNPNKQAVYEVTCPPGSRPDGEIAFSRWRNVAMPQVFPDTPDVLHITTIRPDLFKYEPVPVDDPNVVWYLNFADPDLFSAYGGGLLAQDELQVLEHPALGSLRQALIASRIPCATIEDDEPTPVLVKGVERCGAFATTPGAVDGAPRGLYGNRFAEAPVDVVRRAVQRIVPPTRSNILAIMAPVCRYYGGTPYTREEILHVLKTAVTGFEAARLESERDRAGLTRTVIHTGFWGCGAFGGDRTLMTILQVAAARLVQVDLVFHAFDAAGAAEATKATTILERIMMDLGHSPRVDGFVDAVTRREFRWGTSDGN